MNVFELIFKELAFENKGTFSFACKSCTEEGSIQVYISLEHSSQVYLIAEVQNNELAMIEKQDAEYFGAIAGEFRKQDYHLSEMDKNTILILQCKCQSKTERDNTSRVRIEDTPYFFKRHVFFYTDEEKKEVEKWMKELKDQDPITQSISDYIMDIEKFEKYQSSAGDGIYSYLSGIISKITAFPIRISDSEEVKTIDEYMEDYLQKSKTQLDVSKLNGLLDINWSDDISTEEIINYWDSSVMED